MSKICIYYFIIFVYRLFCSSCKEDCYSFNCRLIKKISYRYITQNNSDILLNIRRKNEQINNLINKYKKRKLIYVSEVILTIRGKGTQQILNNKSIPLWNYKIHGNKNYIFNNKPSEILVNGKRANKIDFYVYNLILEENNISIRFNEALTNCNAMFYGLSNIINIIFNNFDSSKVTSFEGMFHNCENLISLDISNLNVSSVNQMGHLFKNCFNLISINLSNLDTSSVTDMGAMFKNCYKLISIDINHFDTSSVIN